MGWVGTVFLLLGRYFIGEGKSVGLFLSFVGDTLWMIVGLQTGGTTGSAIAFTGGVMALLDLVGWCRQRSNHKYWNSMVVPRYMRSGYKI